MECRCCNTCVCLSRLSSHLAVYLHLIVIIPTPVFIRMLVSLWAWRWVTEVLLGHLWRCRRAGRRLQGTNEVGCRLVGSVDGVEVVVVVVVVGRTKSGVEEDSRVGGAVGEKEWGLGGG